MIFSVSSSSSSNVTINGNGSTDLINANVSGANRFQVTTNGAVVINSSGISTVPLTINAQAGQTADLMDLNVGGVSKVIVNNAGRILSASTIGGTYLTDFAGNLSAKMGTINGVPYSFATYSMLAIGSAEDVNLYRDAANTLAQRNGGTSASVAAQAFRLADFYTDSSNYRRGEIGFQKNANALTISTETLGTGVGTGGSIILAPLGTTRLTIATNGTATFANAIVAGSDIFPAAASGISFGGTRAYITSPADSIILLQNNSSSDFNRLQFGGTTASFPSLKRSSASLVCRLADDSANAAFTAASLTTNAPNTGTAGTWKLGVLVSDTVALDTTRYVQLDVGGTLYKLLVSSI